MKDNKTRILIEKTEEGMVNAEVEGRLKDLLNILLTGIEHMFEDPLERVLFKSGLRQVYANRDAEEKEAAE